jgi:hypothetical protein
VRFRLPKTSKGINTVEVVLEPSDTYQVRFLKATGEPVSEYEGIHSDQLQELFTRETELDTHL